MRVSVNVEGINQHSSLSVEILDREFQPISGYERDACRGPKESGLARPVTWQHHSLVAPLTGQIRIRVDFGGLRPEDVRLYAVYIEQV